MYNTIEKELQEEWTSYQNLTSKEQTLFNEALNMFFGVHYLPTSISTQIINNTNYKFKCIAKIPQIEKVWEAIVEVHQPLNGNPYIIAITTI